MNPNWKWVNACDGKRWWVRKLTTTYQTSAGKVRKNVTDGMNIPSGLGKPKPCYRAGTALANHNSSGG
jgi:hypothetical protein